MLINLFKVVQFLEFLVYNRLSKKSCGIFIEFSIVHKIGYNNAI